MGAVNSKVAVTAVLMLVTGLAGCGDNSHGTQAHNGSAGSEQPEDRYRHTVADALGSSWPANAEPVDQLDSVPTRENIMVVLDMSGSMASKTCSGTYRNKAEAARAVLGDWVNQVDPEANLGLVVFDANGVTVRTPLGQHNREHFVEKINQSRPIGGTPLRSAIELALEQLEYRSAHQQGYGDYRIMVITDGEHSNGEDPAVPLNRIFSNPSDPTQVHTVGFCIDDSALNQPGLTVYQSAENPEELRDGLNRVLAESASFENIEDFDG